jgi:hypothetical protein
MKKLLVVVLVLSAIAASVAGAASYKGKWGLTVMDPARPIGVAYGLSDKAALDVGFGFDKPKGVSLAYAVGAGFRAALVSGEKANLFFRLGADYSTAPTAYADSIGNTIKTKAFGVTGSLGGEWWASDKLSFHVTHGVKFTSSKIGDGESNTSFGSYGDVLGSAGFTLWFGGK